MKTLTLVSAFAALAMAGTAAIAQPGHSGGDRRGPPPAERLSKEDRAALFDARMAAVPAGLKLTEAQRKLWAPVEKALRDNQTNRVEFLEEMKARAESDKRPDYMDRLVGRVEHARESAKQLSDLSEAMKPFWASLSEDQKRLYPLLVHQGGKRGDKQVPRDVGQKGQQQPPVAPRP
jgi:hypothetical protein